MSDSPAGTTGRSIGVAPPSRAGTPGVSLDQASGPGAGGRRSPAPHAAPVEVELKYAIRDVEALEPFVEGDRLGGLAVGPERIAIMEDRYIDTADRALERGGYAARLRERASGTQIGLKSLARMPRLARGEESGRVAGRVFGNGTGDTSVALHRRTEIQGPATASLSPRAWPESEARSLLLALAGSAPLAERFRIRQLRRGRDLAGERGRVALTLDDVEVIVGNETVGSFAAIEVELVEGDESQLADVAQALESTGLVVPEALSKFELAARMAEAPAGGRAAADVLTGRFAEDAAMGVADENSDDGAVDVATARVTPAGSGCDDSAEGVEPSGAVRPVPQTRGWPGQPMLPVGKTPGVRADDSLAEAGRKILRFHVARMLAREDGTRSGRDPEDLHSMRVATRRMRAAWRIFGDAYRPRRVRRYVGELRTLAAELGRVRDLDVMIDGLEAYAAALPGSEAGAIQPLVQAWRVSRSKARDTLLKTLDSDSYRRFVEDYVEFVETEGAAASTATAVQPSRVRDTAGSRLWTAYEAVRAYDTALRWADIPTLHQLRIAAKRLRYTIEFFREPLEAEATPLIERVTALQDHLGFLHDADVAAGLARSFLVERSARMTPETTDAVGRYLRNREQEVIRLRRALPPVWRRVVSVEFRRSLGRAVSTL